jgi:diacylglycerol kinase
MQKNKFDIKKCLKSFKYALNGIFELFKTENNTKIHLIAALIAIGAGFILKISSTEWCFIIFAIALVIVAEGFNTVLEKIADHLFPEKNEMARSIKDISAGAVLICAIAAFIAGLIIFLPKLFSYFY